MNSIDAGAYLTGQASQQASAPAMSDADILKLAAGPSRAQASASYVPPNLDSPEAYARAAASVLPQMANPLANSSSPFLRGLGSAGARVGTWLENSPTAMGGDIYKMKQLLGMKLDPMEQAVIQQAQKRAPGAGTIGDVLATLPATMAAPEALGAMGLTKAVANPYTLGAIQGGIQGAMTADPGQRLQQGLIGALTGAGGAGLGQVGSKFVSGMARTPAAQTLLDHGITLPPGMLGHGGVANTLEQASTHIPLVGNWVGAARNAVPAQVSERMFQDAVAPGQLLPKGLGVNDAVTALKGGYDTAYDSALGGYNKIAPTIMRTQGPDISLQDAFKNVINQSRQGLDPKARAVLGQRLQGQLQEALRAAQQSGGLKATDLQAFRSTLRTLARDAPEGTTEKAVRSFWDDAQQKVTQAIKSQISPKDAQALDAIDANYGKFATVQDFATAVKDRTPTMNDWSNAIARNTPDKVYAGGGGWNRGLVKAAAQTVKPTVAHTGALGVGTIAPMAAGLTAVLEHPAAAIAHLAHPAGQAAAAGTALGLGALRAAYSKAGMQALAGQSAPQKAMQGLLARLHPDLRQGLGLAGRSGLLGALASGGLLQAPSQ